MTILLVDDEENTREVLGAMLHDCGFKNVLQAKNGEEALRTLDAEKGRIRMIISDWEMPVMDGLVLLGKIALRSALDSAPFLMISSDPPEREIAAAKERNPRLDHFLLKPFRVAALAKSLSLAFAARVSKHGTVLIVAGSDVPIAGAVRVASREAFDAAVAGHGRTLGLVLADPATAEAIGAEAFAAFKKTPLGATTPIVCLSRDPRRIGALRLHAQVFAEAPTGIDEWNALLSHLRTRSENAWDVDHALIRAKAALQEKKFKVAQSLLESATQIDPENSDVYALRGDAYEKMGDAAKAALHYERATELNPCSPRAYLKLLDLLSGDDPRREKIATRAVAFCPGHPEILKKTETPRVSK